MHSDSEPYSFIIKSAFLRPQMDFSSSPTPSRERDEIQNRNSELCISLIKILSTLNTMQTTTMAIFLYIRGYTPSKLVIE